MNQPRSHTPIIPHEGKLYIFGGGGPEFKSLQSTACYDPATNEWQELTPMPTARSGTIGCKVGDKIYIIGGGFKQPDGMFRFLKTVEIYDPATDTWEQGPDMLMPHDYPGGLVFGPQPVGLLVVDLGFDERAGLGLLVLERFRQCFRELGRAVGHAGSGR